MHLVIIGAGSQSTPRLFLTPEVTSLCRELSVTLVGRDDAKTGAIAAAISKLRPEYRLQIANIAHDLSGCFESADIILIQPRYGGYDARRYDETFPHRFGCPGDEGVGIGALANAWRSWPQLHTLLARIESAQSKAAIIFLSAPLPVLTRCALAAHPALRWYALCELPLATLKDVAERYCVDWRTINYDYAGTNHLGWFDRLQCASADLIDVMSRTAGEGEFPSTALVRRLGAVPLKYLEMHYYRRIVTARQRANAPRSDVLDAAARRALAAYTAGEPQEILAAVNQRNARWYDDAVAPFIAWLAGRPVETPFFLTTKNRGYLPALHADDVVEIPHTASRELQIRHRTKPLEPHLATTLRAFVNFERIAARAVLEADESAIAEAIAAHPWVQPGDTLDAARAVVESLPASAMIAR